MAAIASVRPPGPIAKPKRPIPSTIHTVSNGTHATSTPSPSVASKRLPPGSQAPTSAGSGITNGGITPNGTAQRIVRRKDSTKPGDNSGKPRLGRPPLESANSSAKPAKRVNEPYVKTEAWILKKYRKAQPSLIMHLHPQYFRFDQQDGSFSYTSPMRILLEHIKNQTVPAEMLDELHAAGVRFYESCLIVQIHDHRNTTNSSTSNASASKNDQEQPFSMHNWNQYITPSPHVPYPKTEKNVKSEDATNKDKQAADLKNGATQGPKIFTTVLFPTAMTLQDDLFRLAMPPKQKQVNGQQPPAKKLKPTMSKKALEAAEADVILATAPPLFLEPVESIGQMAQVYEKLADPLCNRLPPAPKSRKRTIAELAADEALAAEQQSFMLIMDERLAPNISAATSSKAIVAEAEANSSATEARFEKFKLLAQIKQDLAEAKQRVDEKRMQQQQQEANAAQQQAAQMRARMDQERVQEAAKAREMQLKQQQELMRNKQAQVMPQQVPQTQQGSPMQIPAVSGPHGHPVPNNAMITAQQIAASQGAHSSPIIRQMSPQNVPSPAMNGMLNRPQAASMGRGASGQGAGSPPRPGSAIPPGHPGAVPMVPQRSTHPPSRHGTPAMANGTPRLQQGTPVMRNVTPTPRMTQASPIAHPVPTPMMPNGIMGTAHMNGQSQLTLAQQQQFFIQQQQLQQQQRQAAQAHAHQQQQQQQQQQQHQQAMMETIRARQLAHSGQAMNPQQMQAMLAIQQQAAHQQAQQQQAQEVFRANMTAMRQQMAAQQSATGRGIPNGMMGTPTQQTGQAMQIAQMSDMQRRLIVQKIYQERMMNLANQYGGKERIPAEETQQARNAAVQQANLMVGESRRKQAALAQQQQMNPAQQRAAMMAHMQQAGHMNGQMNGQMHGMPGM